LPSRPPRRFFGLYETGSNDYSSLFMALFIALLVIAVIYKTIRTLTASAPTIVFGDGMA
jgi:hypothetical protein